MPKFGNANHFSAHNPQKCAIRAGVEGLVNEIANAHGARKSRHKTEQLDVVAYVFICRRTYPEARIILTVNFKNLYNLTYVIVF